MAVMSPVVVVSGRPAWSGRVAVVLDAHGFALKHYDEPDGYVSRLTDDGAALILVDGERDDWRYWATTPKTSPATRRIPILLVARDPAIRQEARSAGADMALRPEALVAEMPRLLADHARVPDPAASRRLREQCQEPLPAEALEAIAQFNAGEYYKQHDLLEALWMAEDGPVRDLYRAILQVGIAYYQITRGNRRGALKMLLRSVQWLAPLPEVCRGVDVGQLREDAARVRAALEGAADLSAFDRGLLRPVRLVEPPGQGRAGPKSAPGR